MKLTLHVWRQKDRTDPGRMETYAAADVSLPSLRLSALQVAVAMAVSSGAHELEAALVLGDDSADDAGVAAVRDLSPAAMVRFADSAGRLRS